MTVRGNIIYIQRSDPCKEFGRPRAGMAGYLSGVARVEIDQRFSLRQGKIIVVQRKLGTD